MQRARRQRDEKALKALGCGVIFKKKKKENKKKPSLS